MPTKRELMADNMELRKRIKRNEELLMQAAIKAKDLSEEIAAIKRRANEYKKPK